MIPSSFEMTLNRRRFIKLAGLATGLVAVAPMAFALDITSQPVELDLGVKKYRGTADGRILLSIDGGQSWKQIASFGSEIRVQTLSLNEQGLVKAQLQGNHSPFWVQTTNDRIWLTENFRAHTQA